MVVVVVVVVVVVAVVVVVVVVVVRLPILTVVTLCIYLCDIFNSRVWAFTPLLSSWTNKGLIVWHILAGFITSSWMLLFLKGKGLSPYVTMPSGFLACCAPKQGLSFAFSWNRKNVCSALRPSVAWQWNFLGPGRFLKAQLEKPSVWSSRNASIPTRWPWYNLPY